MATIGDRFGANKIAIYLGKLIQEEIPEVAEEYRNRRTLNEIVDYFNITFVYNVTRTIAKSAVSKAIRGNHKDKHENKYSGLIKSREELNKLAQEHTQIGNKKGGQISGKICRAKNLGFFKRTQEEKTKDREKAISNSLKTRGLKQWVEREYLNGSYIKSEIEFAYELSLCHEFTWITGFRPGHPNYQAISEAINKIYHNEQDIRNANSLKIALIRYRKNLEK